MIWGWWFRRIDPSEKSQIAILACCTLWLANRLAPPRQRNIHWLDEKDHGFQPESQDVFSRKQAFQTQSHDLHVYFCQLVAAARLGFGMSGQSNHAAVLSHHLHSWAFWESYTLLFQGSIERKSVVALRANRQTKRVRSYRLHLRGGSFILLSVSMPSNFRCYEFGQVEYILHTRMATWHDHDARKQTRLEFPIWLFLLCTQMQLLSILMFLSYRSGY